MVVKVLVGTRIRERRTQMGLRQAALAKACEISPSYLNLIEHNRRNIGGKLLSEIAKVLETEPANLRAGAAATTVDALMTAAQSFPASEAELEHVDDFAARYPGWAKVVSEQGRRIRSLERNVATLTDRMNEDPVLSDAMHDILSTITGITSVIDILSDDEGVDPEWRVRFLRNMREDSERLTEASRYMAARLDGGADKETVVQLPEDELMAWLEEQGFRIATLEKGWSVEMALSEAKAQLSPDAVLVAENFLKRYAEDVALVPLEPLEAALGNAPPDPSALAREFGVSLPVIFRRLASLPEKRMRPSMGFATCDATGTIGLRKSIDGFPIRRFGTRDRLWPLFAALQRPLTPIRERVEADGRYGYPSTVYAISEPVETMVYDRPAAFEVTMLVVPDRGVS